MRYITDFDGYVKQLSFGADIECDGLGCTEYTGAVPTGYTSLEDWYLEEADKLYRWKIVDGNLTLDSTAVAPVEKGDYIIDHGTDENGWHWEKWASGKAVCYKYATSTVDCTTASGALYQGTVDVELPSDFFTACHNVDIDAAGSTGAGYAFFGRYVYYETYINALFFATVSAVKDISYSVKVIGRWK